MDRPKTRRRQPEDCIRSPASTAWPVSTRCPPNLPVFSEAAGASVYVDNPPEGQSSPASNSLQWLHRTNTFPLRTATHDVKPLLAQLRVVKDQGEIELIRHATNASIASHMAALANDQAGPERARRLGRHAVPVPKERLRASGLRAHRGRRSQLDRPALLRR